MKDTLSYKILRINYIFFALLILTFTFSSFNKVTFYVEDFVFIILLIISYVLISRFNVELNGSYVSFEDYIVIITYFIFNINIVFFIILASQLILFLLDNKNFTYRKWSFINNRHIFNTSLVIISSFLASISITLGESIKGNSLELIFQVILFSSMFLIFNYSLFFVDSFIKYNTVSFSSFYDEFLYFSTNFITSCTISYLSLYLYNIFQYTLVVVFTIFLIFLSFSLNKISTLRAENKYLYEINKCNNFMMAKINYINKLYNVLETIEPILPFSYGGIYFSLNENHTIYPVCYKSELNLDPIHYGITNINKSELFNIIETGKYIYTNDSNVIKDIFPPQDLWNKVEAILVLPIYSSSTFGCIILALNQYKDIDNKIELLTLLTKNLSMLCENTFNNYKSSNKLYTKYNDFLELLNKNISGKIFFTLAIIEVKNYSHIINTYNMEVYQSLKKDIAKQIHSMLSPLENILYFEKEDIFICFNFQDSLNALEKLNIIKKHFSNYKFNNKIKAEILFALSEYPLDGINKEDIINNTYKSLHKIKNTFEK